MSLYFCYHLFIITYTLLLLLGADYHGYVSDITCSFPVSGIFTADQRAVYEGVLSAQKAAYKLMLPGASWIDCHLAAELEIVKSLQNIGILHSQYTVEEITASDIGCIFFPHGLGHLIGLDTHDVGGYIDGTPDRPKNRGGVKKLRTARTLLEGMVLTNEPGCYFIDALLDSALADVDKAKYINTDILQRFRGSGGVRLEDVVVVTSNLPCNLTTCPRTINEVESVMSGGQWPPMVDEAPELYRRWGKLSKGGFGMDDISLGV